jgi:hypothetical protein
MPYSYIRISTEKKGLLYDVNLVDMARIEMVYQGNGIDFDFLSPSQTTPSYIYNQNSKL